MLCQYTGTFIYLGFFLSLLIFISSTITHSGVAANKDFHEACNEFCMTVVKKLFQRSLKFEPPISP